MGILEHLGMKVPDIEGHGVIISRANVASGDSRGCVVYSSIVYSV